MMGTAAIGHVGVLTSGGDSPGMNAAIRAVARAASYHGIRATGILGGYDGLVNDRVKALGPRDVSGIVQLGGTMLRSARSDAFRTPQGRRQAMATMERHGMDALVVIGGDGSFTGAQVLHIEHGVRCVGIPGTIDNDLAGTDRTLGFDTAVNTAVQAIDRIRDTASSHDRLFFVEVMGRHSGQIALTCAVAAGAEYAMLPERDQGIDELVKLLNDAARTRSSLIVGVAEGDEEGGAFSVAGKVKERTTGYDIRVSVLGHLLRGGAPTVADRLLAGRTGVAAVEHLLSGGQGEMVGICGDQVVFTPFTEALNGKKPIDPELYRVLGILSV